MCQARGEPADVETTLEESSSSGGRAPIQRAGRKTFLYDGLVSVMFFQTVPGNVVLQVLMQARQTIKRFSRLLWLEDYLLANRDGKRFSKSETLDAYRILEFACPVRAAVQYGGVCSRKLQESGCCDCRTQPWYRVTTSNPSTLHRTNETVGFAVQAPHACMVLEL